MAIGIGAGMVVSGVGSLLGAFGGSKQQQPRDYFPEFKQLENSLNTWSRNNYNQQKDYEDRRVAQINNYNYWSDTAQSYDYLEQSAYNFDLAVKNWQHQVNIQEYEGLVQQKLYQKSLGIASSQLNLNDLSQNLAFAVEDFNLKNLMKQAMFSKESELIGLQNAVVEHQLNKKATGLALAGIGQQQDLLNIQRGELGIEEGRLDLERDRIGLKAGELGIQAAELGIQAQQLGIQKAGLVKEAEFVGQEELLLDQKNAIAQQFIQDELTESKRQATFEKQGAYVETLNKQGAVLTQQAGKSRGKAEQVVLGEFFRGMSQLESTLTGQNRQAALRMKEIQTQTSFDKAKLQLKRDKLGLQARGLDLQGQGLGLQGQRLGLAAGELDLQAQGLGLQGSQLGLAGQRLDVQGQQLDLEAAGIGLQQERYDVGLENSITDTMFNVRVIDQEVMQAAEQATMNKKNISIQKLGADLNVVANMMIKPSNLPTPPPPSKPPARSVINTPIVEASFIPDPREVSAFELGYRPPAEQSSGSNWLSTAGNVLGAAGQIIGGFNMPVPN